MKEKLKPIYFLLRTIALRAIAPMLRRGRAGRPAAGDIKRILVIRIDRMGDFILTTPLIRTLAKSLPGAEISMMTGPYTAELAKNIPNLKQVITYGGKKELSAWRSRKAFARRFKGQFDMVIDPLESYSLETALLAFWTGAPWRLGFDIAGRGVFFNISAKPGKGLHFIDQSLLLLEAAGLKIEHVKEPQLLISEETAKRVGAYLEANKVGKEDTLIGVHLGGYYPSQRWTPEGFAAVADELSGRPDTKIIFMAGKGEKEILSATLSRINFEPVVWDGESIEDFAGVVARCRLLICNNSGPLHLAVSLGVPTVSTMGPTVPWMWWPRGDKHIVMRKDLPCSPCNLGECAGHECMKLIEPSEIIAAAEKLLSIHTKNN